MSLGKKLKSLRLTAGLSLQQVATQSDVSKTHIFEIESGKTSPSFAVAEKLASAFGVDVNYFADKKCRTSLEHYHELLEERVQNPALKRTYQALVREFALMQDMVAMQKFDEALWRLAEIKLETKKNDK